MSVASRHRSLAVAGITLIALSGCATQEAVTEQTSPIKTQIAGLDASLQSVSDESRQTRDQLGTLRTRERALTARLDELATELKAVRDQVLAQGRQHQADDAQWRDTASRLGERATQAELRLDELATLTHDLSTQTEANAGQLAATLGLTSTVADQLGAQSKRLDSIAAQSQATSEQALASRKEIEALSARGRGQSEGMARLEQSAGHQSARMQTVAEQIAAVRKDIDALSAADQILAERHARAEKQSEQRDTLWSELVEQTRAAQQAENAGANQAKALTDRLPGVEQRLEQVANAHPERMARIEARLDDLARQTKSAIEMAAQNDIRINGKVAFSVTLTEDKTLYPLHLQSLGPKDRAALDALSARVKGMGKDYHLEIQGHTDNIGVDDYHYQLGKARAEVVKRYLHDQGGIPLGWMSVISYGATQPIDPRGLFNRRIVIQTLVQDSGK